MLREFVKKQCERVPGQRHTLASCQAGEGAVVGSTGVNEIEQELPLTLPIPAANAFLQHGGMARAARSFVPSSEPATNPTAAPARKHTFSGRWATVSRAAMEDWA